MIFNEYPTRDQMMVELAGVIAAELIAVLDKQPRASLAVPGGTTPGPIFDVLCKADLDWSRVDIMLTDERWVPETSERSNTALLRRRLLQDKAAAATLIPMRADAERAEDALDELSANIPDPLSVVLLGMGADMHTASIFPEADLLAEAFADDAPALLPMRAPGAPEPRITLTARVLNAAAHRHVLITGSEKKEALDKASQISDPLVAPITAILSGTNVHWAP